MRKHLQIQAGLSSGADLAKSTFAERVTIRSPKDIARFDERGSSLFAERTFRLFVSEYEKSCACARNISMGSLNASIVHPREVFRAAIKRSSASIICVHNHPSGDPTPSPEDIQLTHRLVEAGTIIGIEVLDHVIIGDQRFISLKEQGFM